MKKPVIGITCSIEEKEDRNRKYPQVYPFDYVKRQYYFAIEKAGGMPIILPNLYDLSLVDNILETVDGLLFSGGYDLDPKNYGEDKPHRSVKITPGRDRFELSLVKKARERNIPIFGICRGCQIINVAYGGTLYQDISLRKEFTLEHKIKQSSRYKKRHPIVIKEGSKLFSILRKKEIEVNTSHHQLIKEIAPGFVVSAFSKEDGVVEALESPEDDYLLSVQWHPEVPYDEKNSILLFRSLVESSKKRG
ncbi:MAG TPA: gamma-glutamyl-gamma-aminobutyrate hydrolase family protein [Terriglobales bacterium]|nr:gamma-glutamyl-gamma-aminobutyrate hydrolase family protein [Terriglobales bacterium]